MPPLKTWITQGSRKEGLPLSLDLNGNRKFFNKLKETSQKKFLFLFNGNYFTPHPPQPS